MVSITATSPQDCIDQAKKKDLWYVGIKSKDDKNYLDKVVESKELHYHPDEFIAMYNEDQLGGLIRNVEFWIKDVFANLVIKK